MLDNFKKQVGLYVVIIGAIVTFMWQVSDFRDDTAQRAALDGYRDSMRVVIFSNELAHIKELSNELKEEVRAVQDGQTGLDDEGAARSRRMVRAIQAQITSLQEGVEGGRIWSHAAVAAVAESLGVISRQVAVLRATVRTDTFTVMRIDTFPAPVVEKKKGRWWWPGD